MELVFSSSKITQILCNTDVFFKKVVPGSNFFTETKFIKERKGCLDEVVLYCNADKFRHIFHLELLDDIFPVRIYREGT